MDSLFTWRLLVTHKVSWLRLRLCSHHSCFVVGVELVSSCLRVRASVDRFSYCYHYPSLHHPRAAPIIPCLILASNSQFTFTASLPLESSSIVSNIVRHPAQKPSLTRLLSIANRSSISIHQHGSTNYQGSFLHAPCPQQPGWQAQGMHLPPPPHATSPPLTTPPIGQLARGR